MLVLYVQEIWQSRCFQSTSVVPCCLSQYSLLSFILDCVDSKYVLAPGNTECVMDRSEVPLYHAPNNNPDDAQWSVPHSPLVVRPLRAFYSHNILRQEE